MSKVTTPVYDKRHGGPFDRGRADSYYRRGCTPHYYRGDTYRSEMVTVKDMTEEEIEAYYAAYNENEEAQDFKQWD